MLHNINQRLENNAPCVIDDKGVDKLVSVCIEAFIVFGKCYRTNSLQSVYAFFYPVIRSLPTQPEVLVMNAEDMIAKF